MRKWHPALPTQDLSPHATRTGVEQGKSRARKQEITESSCWLSFLDQKQNPRDAHSRLRPALVIYCVRWPRSQLPMETTQSLKDNMKNKSESAENLPMNLFFFMHRQYLLEDSYFHSVFHVWKNHKTYRLRQKLFLSH